MFSFSSSFTTGNITATNLQMGDNTTQNIGGNHTKIDKQHNGTYIENAGNANIQTGDGSFQDNRVINNTKDIHIETVHGTNVAIGNNITQNITIVSQEKMKEIEKKISIEDYQRLLKVLPNKYLHKIQEYKFDGELFKSGDLVFVTGTGIDTNHPEYDINKYFFIPGNIGIVIGKSDDSLEIFWARQNYAMYSENTYLDKFISRINYRYVKRKFTLKDSYTLQQRN
jgi:hypothetical protein